MTCGNWVHTRETEHKECQGLECVTLETRIDTLVLVPSSSGGSTQETLDSNMGIGMMVMA